MADGGIGVNGGTRARNTVRVFDMRQTLCYGNKNSEELPSMFRALSVHVAQDALRFAIAKARVWAPKRATQPVWRPAATGGTR